MRFYWEDSYTIDRPFGYVAQGFNHIMYQPYLCIYTKAERDGFVAQHKVTQVGELMLARYIKKVLQPLLVRGGEVLVAEDYPE